MIHKSEFGSWKNSIVTETLHKTLADNLSIQAAELINRTDANTSRDMYLRGIIAGFRAVLEWEPEFVDEEVENES